MKKKLSLKEHIYNELKQAIFSRKIPLNTQLNEELLSEVFNVSRTPIRSVLKRMQNEKIIQIIPHKGAYIYQPTPKEFEDVINLRIVLEKEAIKIACKKATEEQINELEEYTLKEEKLYKSGDYANGIRTSTKFHHKLMTMTTNDFMIQYNQELMNIMNIYIVFHENTIQESPRSPEEHREIINAIKNRDEKKAIELIDLHFKSIRDNLNNNQSESSVDFSRIFKPYPKS
ncbi:transcriptional regulator, GntR family [Alteribacillus persepolensis]|uniref:Transcriptional regulator, GntR family n=1 Tax=Alteribacillus persepolensis TaxID=568899 RepID=A0A1G8KDJ9_9BACI|nr:GntR family transcriptional regulator [Alteribacillus persepolensis]SDI41517.1 transcriptional regulator, GntR family [Alteribacillus persepolensis]